MQNSGEFLALLAKLSTFIPNSFVYRVRQSSNGSWNVVSEPVTGILFSAEHGWVLNCVDSSGTRMQYILSKTVGSLIFLSESEAERERAARNSKLVNALTKQNILSRLADRALIGATVYYVDDETFEVSSGVITNFGVDENYICHLTILFGDNHQTYYDNDFYFPGFYFSVEGVLEELRHEANK